MDKDQENKNIGEQLKDALTDAIQTGDFQDLNSIVAGTVHKAIDEAKHQVKNAKSVAGEFKDAGGFRQNRGYNFGGGDTFRYRKSEKDSQRRSTFSYNRSEGAKAESVNFHSRAAVRSFIKKVGSVAGTLLIVFGSIGAGLMGMVMLILGIVLLTGEPAVFPAFLGFSMAFLSFVLMIERGCVRKDRLKRAERYVQLCEDRKYINIDELALHMDKSVKYILKDLKKMIQIGIFPEGHLDEEKTCFMLDDETYRQYLDIRRQRMAMAREAQTADAPKEEIEEASVDPESKEELNSLMKEGQECIQRLRDMNDSIEGEVISAKLFRLENLLKEIFDRVKEQPNQAPQMQKFMDYYLPTTMKLVQSYGEFDSVSVPGADIKTAKTEIEKTLDTINNAFGELLNNLYRDAVFDATTDAQVLQSMLAREGLTREMEKEREMEPVSR